MKLLADLNQAQRQAVETIAGPLLVLAGPGSGKTRVITYRVAHLLDQCQVKPYRVMAVTFTNKAAREMVERLRSLVGQRVQDLSIGTFHALCTRLLRREGQYLAVGSDFVIYDEDDQMGLIKQALKDLRLDEKLYSPRAILSSISNAKSELVDAEGYGRRLVASYFHEVVRRVYEQYQTRLLQSKALDFDDLIMTTVRLLQDRPDVLEKYQSRLLHLLVDEFQDTNMAQYALIKLLAGLHRNVCVVGDPDQSVYSWRNADIRNILNFERDYPDATVVVLEQNYRSTQNILGVAQSIIVANTQRKQKNLWTENDAGHPIIVAEVYDEREEAQMVVAEVDRLMSRGQVRPGDCAVMYRTNAQSRALEDAMVRYGMPYKLVGGTRFYERREVKDVLAYLRLVHNPYDVASLNRVINVPPRGIGQKTMDDLRTWARQMDLPAYAALQVLSTQEGAGSADGDTDQADTRSVTAAQIPFGTRPRQLLLRFFTLLSDLVEQSETLPVAELVDYVLQSTGYREHLQSDPERAAERWENIQELRTVAKDYDQLSPRSALRAFLEEVALVSDVDSLEEKQDAVTLITLHAAKGLEFPVVFIVGLEEGILPHSRSLQEPSQMEEERRLCYVGVTRARERLYLLHAYRRTLYGNSEISRPSRFLDDLPSAMVQRRGASFQSSPSWDQPVSPPPARAAMRAIEPEPLPAFEPGARVRHAKFGEGIVVSCTEAKGDREITVSFKGQTGLKKMLLSFAKLERVEH
ncbi:MAG: AAA family ATPase [Chloroflexota bacterium]|nr:MAG: AAA family ATPase [Chloroflexota bacterium]